MRAICLALLISSWFDCSSQNYTYDAGGNLSKDPNKKIQSIHYNYLNLADTIAFEDGRKIIYSYSAAGHKLREQSIDASGKVVKKADYVNGCIYNNDSLRQIGHTGGRAIPMLIGDDASPWVYQYDEKDHLGNVRTLLTSRQDIDHYKATFESANVAIEQNQFQRYEDARRINSDLFDHTKIGPTGFSQRLNGSLNEEYGLAKSLCVMAGDVVNLEVFAKYADADVSHWKPMLADLMTLITSGAVGTVVDGAGYPTNGNTPFPFAGLSGTSDDGEPGPKAYLNWLIFDENYLFKNGGYVKIDPSAKEDGSNVPHDRLSAQLTIKESGFVYAYVSNEGPSLVDVFFDDFTVELVKGPIVQQTDYDPFGLTIVEVSREHEEANNFLYNGKELQKDFDLNWYDYGARMYDAALGRWHVIDAKTEKYSNWSPYNYVMNNPVKAIDPDGNEIRVISDDPDNLVIKNARVERGHGGLSNSYDRVHRATNVVVYLIATHRPVIVRTKMGSLVTNNHSGTITGTHLPYSENKKPVENLKIERDKKTGRYFIVSNEAADGFESTSSTALRGIDVTNDVKAGKEIQFIALSDYAGPNSSNLKGVSEALFYLDEELEGISRYLDEKVSQDRLRRIALEWQKELQEISRIKDPRPRKEKALDQP